MIPLVSIIIPVYNSEDYIADTIFSCINQSYKNIEIILINDGSTDNSEKEILKFNDNRIHYFKIENSGACEARNFGISKAKGQLLQFLDHDDLLETNKIISQIEYFEKYGEDYIYSGTMGSVSGNVKTIDEDYEVYQKNFLPKEYFEVKLIEFGKAITTGAWLIPIKLIQTTHGWDSRSGLNDDGEYFMRIILNSKGVVFCREAIFYFRRDVPNSLSKQFNSKEVYVKWLFSYQSFVKHFKLKLEDSIARQLGWKALSIYYCASYPLYPDLLKQCKKEINLLGYSRPFPIGGKGFTLASKYIGVDRALSMWHYKHKLLHALKRS
ncbi:MAG: glycosyltransferase [Sphingobacteriaceae bacterium]|nr:MAG: glycosyltransferase [Sphingobacteriaceae bacterium]